MPGALYIIGTPIGNIGDMTPRSVEVLRGLDVLYCEDTRVTGKLLSILGLKLPLRALSDDHGQERWDAAVHEVVSGRRVGFVADAGMPGISDPARRLARAAWRERIAPIVIPGVSAVATLLAACPFVAGGFRFLGFAPRKAGERGGFINRLVLSEEPCVFFESPHRFHACLDELCSALEPERELLIGREMTKLHEQLMLLKAGRWPDLRRAVTALGEFTVAVAARPVVEQAPRTDEVRDALQRLHEAGFTRRDSVKAVSAVLELSVNEVKQLAYGE